MGIKQSDYNAISDQLKAANIKIVELEKKLASETSAKDTWYKMKNDADAMLEQIHQVLDAMPNAIPRKSDAEESWNRVERSPVTRLAAWLASRP